MRVNFPAAVALWLHFSSSATVCAARAHRTAPHRTAPHRTAPRHATPRHPPGRARLLASPSSIPHPNRTRPPQREHPPRITLPVVIRLASHSRQQIPSPSATHCHHHCHFAPSAHHRGTPSALTARSALPRAPPQLHATDPRSPLPAPRSPAPPRARSPAPSRPDTVEDSSHRDPTRGTLSGEPPPTPRTPRNARSWPRTRATTRRRENFSRLLPALERSERASATPGASERIDRDSADPTIAPPGARCPPTAHDFRLSLSDAAYE